MEIVRSHRGGIKVDSVPEKGTTFRIAFPAANFSVVPANKKSSLDLERCGKGTLLVVDDDEWVRKLGQKILEMIGFTVLTANDGLEALEIFRQQNEMIKLVLLDLNMPRMDGIEALQGIQQIRGDARVILTSGKKDQIAKLDLSKKPSVRFIQKPFGFEELQAIVLEMTEE